MSEQNWNKYDLKFQEISSSSTSRFSDTWDSSLVKMSNTEVGKTK